MALPHWAHAFSAEVDGDDDELAAMTDLDDDLAGVACERAALDDVLGFAGRPVSLVRSDSTGENDVFKIEDREVVIFEFVRGMG